MTTTAAATIDAINILSEDEVIRDAVEGFIGHGWNEWANVRSGLIDFATTQLDTFTDVVLDVDSVDWDIVTAYFM